MLETRMSTLCSPGQIFLIFADGLSITSRDFSLQATFVMISAVRSVSGVSSSMTISTAMVKHPRFASFEDYLAYTDSGDQCYELFNGELVEVPPESGFNVGIANFLFSFLLPIVGYLRVRGQGLELEVEGEPRNRYPDLTVIKEEHIEQLRSRNTIRLSMVAPDLVVEVVSPGDLQRDSLSETLRDRDYIAKRAQYQSRSILTYWIVDPQVQEMRVLSLTPTGYQEQIYQGNERLPFQDELLSLTAEEVLLAG
jgi:Uma2 family endonuclease